MNILLIIFAAFLVIYFIFNAYILNRVWSMRMKGDAIPKMILFYIALVFLIIAVCIILLISANANQLIGNFLGGI